MTKSQREKYEQQYQKATEALTRIRKELRHNYRSEPSTPVFKITQQIEKSVTDLIPYPSWDRTPKETAHHYFFRKAYMFERLASENRETVHAKKLFLKAEQETEKYIGIHRLTKRKVKEDVPTIMAAAKQYIDNFESPTFATPEEHAYFHNYMMDWCASYEMGDVYGPRAETVRKRMVENFSYLIDEKVEEKIQDIRNILSHSDPIDEEEIPNHLWECYTVLKLEIEALVKVNAYNTLRDRSMPEQLVDLPPFLEIEAWVDLELCANNRFVFHTAGPAKLDQWQKHQQQIEFFLEGKVHIELSDADRITLIPQIDLPDVIPFTADHLAHGQICFGHDTRTGQPYFIPLADMTHMLVMGISGMGKSVFLNQLMQGFLHNIDQIASIYLVDLKGGVELFPYAEQSDRIHVIYRIEYLAPIVKELLILLHKRLELMRENGQRKWSGKTVFFIVDEYAQIQLHTPETKEGQAQHKKLLADLNTLSMLGRSAGVRIIAQLQKGTTDVMSSSFRNNLQSQICFRVPNNLTAAGMFGTSDRLPAEPTRLKRGEFIFYDDTTGETVVLQSAIIMDRSPV